MSDHGRKTDLISSRRECTLMTQTGHSACSRLLPEVDLQRLSMIVSIWPHADQQQPVRALLRRRAEPANGGLLPAGSLIIGDCNTPDRGRVLMMMSLAPARKGKSEDN